MAFGFTVRHGRRKKRGKKRKRSARKFRRPRFKGKRRKASVAKKLTKRQNARTYLSKVPGLQGNRATKNVTLKFAEFIQFDALTNESKGHTFSANGCHIINVLSATGQPYGWDQYKLLYSQYVVNGAKIRCTEVVTNVVNGATASAQYHIILLTEGNHHRNVTPADYIPLDKALQKGMVKMSELKQVGRTADETGATNDQAFDGGVVRPLVLTKTWTLKSVKKKLLSDYNKGDFIISVAGNPSGGSEPKFEFEVVLNNESRAGIGTSAVKTIVFMVEIEYNITFHDPVNVGLS